jgi:hypothetical protein
MPQAVQHLRDGQRKAHTQRHDQQHEQQRHPTRLAEGRVLRGQPGGCRADELGGLTSN